MSFQKRILAWAVSTFGDIAKNRDERAARVAEEAIELAQCEGVSLATVIKIAERVYSRPPGDVETEIADVGISLYALSENRGLEVGNCMAYRWNHLQSVPAEHWANKHRAKVAAGTADLTPLQERLIQPTRPLADAMEVVVRELRNDRGYWMGWQANIAMAILDTPVYAMESKRDWLNRGADNFLKLLTRQSGTQHLPKEPIDIGADARTHGVGAKLPNKGASPSRPGDPDEHLQR